MQCPICMHDLLSRNTTGTSGSSDSSICATPCGHVYHINCLTNWLGNNQICPTCRKACYSSNLIKLFISQNVNEENNGDNGQVLTSIQIVNTKVSDLNMTVDRKMDEVSSLLENIQVAFSTFESRQTRDYSALITENNNLKDHVNGMQSEIQTVRHELQEATDNLSIEKSSNRQLLAGTESLNVELQAKNQEIHRLNSEIENLKEELDTWKDRLEASKITNLKLRETCINNIPQMITVVFDGEGETEEILSAEFE